MGTYNSSLTRVQPFFWSLLAGDPSGGEWLSKLLRSFPSAANLGENLLQKPGRIVSAIPAIGASEEKLIGPPEAFLRWLISHPEHLRWQKNGGTKDPVKRSWREKLCSRGEAGSDEPGIHQQEAISEALSQLDRSGIHGASFQWWCFEGRTHVDFFIEMDRRLMIYVEGKRNERLPAGTLWYPARYQFVRNLEAAGEHAAGRSMACLLMSERPLSVVRKDIEGGLPHMTQEGRNQLLN